MSDLIDRAELLKHKTLIPGFTGEYVSVQNIQAAATVDAVPAVRCKDCVWFADNNNDSWYGCWLFNAIRAGDNKPTLNDYCSYGERRAEHEQKK